MRCEHCQPQLLHYVYDLLEADERTMVSAHVERCPRCQESLKGAQEQAGLLAEAVKEPATDIVFKAPARAAASSTAPTVALEPRRRRSGFLLNRWSIAAGVLLAIFSIGGAIGWSIYRENQSSFEQAQTQLVQAKQGLTQAQQELDQTQARTQKEIRAIHEQIDQLFNDWRKEEAKKRKVLEKGRVQVILNGPQVAQAGANNSYQLQMFKQNSGAAANFMQAPGFGQQQQLPGVPNQGVNVRVLNQRNQETLFNQDLVTQRDGTANFVLPSDIPFKPGDDIRLVFETRSPEGKQVQLGDSLKLVFPEYVTHLATDRPMYRPGETVRFRSLTLERFSLKPAQPTFHLRYRIVAPTGREIYKQEFASQVSSASQVPRKDVHGVGVGEFALPANLPGGQYTLFVSEVNERFREEKRSFIVHRWQAPRLNKEVQFQRTSYGAGDLVRVQLKVVPVQGIGPRGGGNIRVTAKATVDGIDIGVNNTQNDFTDQDGVIAFTFTLPGQIFKGVGSVSFLCDDSGNKETIRRTIPIVVNNLNVAFYPEGGDLIAGAAQRVYFQALTPAGKPADITATLLDDQNQPVAAIKTLADDHEPGINHGQGSFVFTPQAGRRYHVRVDAPIGIERPFLLPNVKVKGVVMTVANGADDAIGVTLQSPMQPRTLLIGAYCRGRMLDHQFVKVPANQPMEVALRPEVNVGGVYRITVFEKLNVKGNLVYRPMAERLIYRKHPAKIDVRIEPNRKSYQPGDKVELNLRALNEKREIVPALALVAVVDQSLLKLADEKTARTMPTHFLLTTEVNHPDDLENADVLLGAHPKAEQALDLLLGCQGWRRFAEQDPQQFRRRQQHAKPPVFVSNSIVVPQLLDAEQKVIDKLDQGYVAKVIELEKTLAAKENQEEQFQQMEQHVVMAQNSVIAAENARAQAEERLREVRAVIVQFGLGGALLALLFVGFLLVGVGLRRLSEGEPARAWLVVGLSLLGFLFLVSVVGTFLFMGEHMMDDFRFGRAKMAPAVAMKGGPMQAAPPVKVAELALPVPEEMAKPEEALQAEPGAAEPVQPRALRKAGARPQLSENGAGADFLMMNQEAPRVQGDFAINQDAGDRELRKQGKYQAILQKQLGRRVQLPPAHDPCIVRVYAHQHLRGKDAVRRDFAETLYWHPILPLPDGKATVAFDLSDSVTRFDVLVYSHTADGRLGANRIEIASKLPFSVEPKVPIEVAQTDRITIPVTLSNESPAQASATLSLRTKGLTLEGLAERGVELKPNENRRLLFDVKPSLTAGDAVVRVAGRTKRASDAVERRFKIVPDGLPITGSVSGVLENAPIEHAITLPEDWLQGTLQVQTTFYPSPVAELQSGLEALLAEPCGCFEQSSSSNYPNVLILDYMKTAGQLNANFRPSPLLEKRARALLTAGYQQLTSFECVDPAKTSSKRGYEWFGGAAPPHEALTAYGLMQFHDMAKVYPVDQAMLQRTEQYLLDQRDKKGGFQRNPKGLDRFGQAPDPVTNAYIIWALTESGSQAKLDVELAALRRACQGTKDPYLLALAALSHLNRGKILEGTQLLRDLRAFQKGDGALPGAKTSITGSQGRDLLVETTALAVLGWVRAGQPADFNPNVNRAIGWLGQQRRGVGAFGATQATILALKALIAHAERHPRLNQGGDISMSVRDAPLPMQAPGINIGPGPRPPFGLPQKDRAVYSPHAQEPIVLTLRDASVLKPGKNVIELRTSAPGWLPYVLTWTYRTRQPANDPAAPVQLSTRLSKEDAKEGDTVKLTAQIENVSGKGQGMTVAILGLPAGLAVPEDFEQLKAYTRLQDGGATPGKISAWELRGRDLVLYWRDLAPNAKLDIEIDLICRLPGFYTGPASRAYLYYDAERTFWIAPLTIRIDPAQ